MAKNTPLFKAPFYKTSNFWTRAIPTFFFFIFIFVFRADVGSVLGGLWTWMWGGGQKDFLTPAFLSSLSLLGYNLFAFLVVFVIASLMVSSQALLPTQNFFEVWNTCFHFLLHIFHWHGPAVFIKDGKVISNAEDWEKVGLGVVVIDFNSAVVLEEQVPPPTLLAPIHFLVEWFLRLLCLYPARKTPRACKAGITFTRKHERIQGVVDLRKQSRARLNVGGYTRDGIEMKALVYSVFTLGQEPDVLPVTYGGQRKKENLRVVNWKKLSDGRIRVEDLVDELDLNDRVEAQQAAQRIGGSGEMRPFTHIDPALQKSWMHELPVQLTPVFNEKRVFDAVYTRARNASSLLSWDEMPVNVAENILKELLLQHNLDELFHPESPQFPISLLRRELYIRMRNNGILAYSLIMHRSGKGLSTGDYDPGDILVSRVRNLTSAKPLRERGIKILASGFNDLLPVSDQVYQQRLENWKVKWASETEEVAAVNELEARRILIQTRKQGLESMISQISRIFETEGDDESRAAAVLQALQSATNDPNTHQMLSQDALSILQIINNRLGIDQGYKNMNPDQNINHSGYTPLR